MKKIIFPIIAIISVSVAAIGGVYLSTSTIVETQAVYDLNNEQNVEEDYIPEGYPPKVGRYYKVNGTRDEYIEIFDDETVQVFGYDSFKIKTLINDDYDKMTEEDRKERQEFSDYYSSRHPYVYDPYVHFIAYKDTIDGVMTEFGSIDGISQIDENTLEINSTYGYVYVYEG